MAIEFGLDLPLNNFRFITPMNTNNIIFIKINKSSLPGRESRSIFKHIII